MVTPQGLLVLRCDYRVSMTIAPSSTSSLSFDNIGGFHHMPHHQKNFRSRSDTYDSNPRISDESATDLGVTSDESQDLKVFATSPPDHTGKTFG